jgi:DNA-binding transcriptional regulator YhcF (GntR family)
MPKYTKAYTDDMILNAMSKTEYRANSAIAAILGCNPVTIGRAMPALEEAGLVTKVVVEIGKEKSITGWVRV